MSLWHKKITPDDLNLRGKNTLSEFLGVQFTEVGDDYLIATMPVNQRTRQPIGILHGGANVVLAETVASTAANAVIDIEKFFCVGLEINANHIRPVKDGLVKAIAKPIHIGRTTQVWSIDIFNDKGKQSCISRMTASVVPRNK